MTSAKKRYSASDREGLAVIFELQKFELYFLSVEHFTLMTDQQALKSAFYQKDTHGCLARWLDFLAEYNFDFQYRSGKSDKAADLLSRIHDGERQDSGEDEGE